MNKYKYLGILLVPFSVYIALTMNGIYTFLPFILLFVIVPLTELFFKPNHKNLTEHQLEIAKKDWFYSLILYAMVPINFSLLFLFLNTINANIPIIDLTGKVLSMGLALGVLGINIGHELGHRTNRLEQLLGEVLLMSSLETHFLPYHNSGHHFNVATPNDPATAKKNEWLFVFWIRSQFGSYIQAWQLESKRLKIEKKSFFSFHNRMLIYTFFHIILLFSIYYFFGITIVLFYFLACCIGILLLETVNYIEHYGLLRKKKKSGRYEVVTPMHSWNSDHMIGRILLFELSRHSDHHHRASKHYQLLDSHESSPQMFTGYPGMMLLALIPPLWFKLMNKRIPN